ncbi:hypothetical protein BR93DRAFT_964724 [Coniochaeta sp. PMI_546]|nr:hypothetical protein BR93DRAFT_964724 [Coniochaeta sp. PMI_546]
MAQAQEAPSRPFPLNMAQKIQFRHPGYGELHNILMQLPRADPVPGITPPTHGVHCLTALTACQIIANNEFANGYLSTDRDGRMPINTPLHGILTEPIYYFHIRGYVDPDPYPVVPTFREWRFPHNTIPDSWPLLLGPDRNSTHCAVTKIRSIVDQAHLVPKEEAEWFQENSMAQYGSTLYSDVDNPSNLIPLNPTHHQAFDKRYWAIVPKPAADGSTSYATHLLSSEFSDMWPQHHSIVLPTASFVLLFREYVFARFAWAILMQLKSFLCMGPRRRLIRALADDTGEYQFMIEFLPSQQLQALYSGGGSRNATPKGARNSMNEQDAEMSEAWTEDYDDVEVHAPVSQWILDQNGETIVDDDLEFHIRGQISEVLHHGLAQLG